MHEQEWATVSSTVGVRAMPWQRHHHNNVSCTNMQLLESTTGLELQHSLPSVAEDATGTWDLLVQLFLPCGTCTHCPRVLVQVDTLLCLG